MKEKLMQLPISVPDKVNLFLMLGGQKPATWITVK
jgi:hypothetical protein